MFWTVRKISDSECSSSALAAGLKQPYSAFRKFARDESGVMTYFALAMLIMMVLVSGIGVDLMRNEYERARIQATLDRAVLAAADLDQTLEPEAVVNDYFAKSGLSQHMNTAPVVESGLNYRIVTAEASSTSPTRFMQYLGVNELPLPAVGTAEERVSSVEISMVLDISGSMSQNSKMPNLRNAAGVFIDTVLKPENADLISVSLVPYTAQVNAGWEIFQNLNVNHVHDFSYCVDFESSDFNSTALSMTQQYEQMQHFESGWNWSYPIGNPGCPQQSYEEIAAFSQDATQLKDRVDDLTPRANTSIHLGMKWGVAMLDPSFQQITNGLDVDTVFKSRPAPYSDGDTLKTVILMTDGQNVDTYRIQPWYYAQSSHYVHWSKYPLFWYLNNYVGSNWQNWFYTKYTAAQADNMLDSICSAAKNEGIVVWSIGFEVTDYSANVMKECASSPSHFFRVEGVEITEAFEAIAKQINQLRLTQ